jgi:hypothetical protein
MINKKNIPENVKHLYEEVLPLMTKSLKHARASSKEILLQISLDVYFAQLALCERFSKKLEYLKELTIKKSD